MVTVYVHGGSRSQRRLAESAVAWYIKVYLPKIKNLDIDVYIKKLDKGMHGYCNQLSDRHYELEISNKIKGYEFATTIMHEMIHVKQYVRNEVKDTNTGSVRWKSKLINPMNLDYWDHPWEKEAYKYDSVIAYTFMLDTGRW